MIARVWRAQATSANAIRYREHFEANVLPALQKLEGYLGAELLSEPGATEVELLVITRWESLEAVRAFTGAKIEEAVVAEEAKALLLTWEPRVRHYRQLVQDRVAD